MGPGIACVGDSSRWLGGRLLRRNCHGVRKSLIAGGVVMHSGGGIGDHSLHVFGRCRGLRRLRLSLRSGARRLRRAGGGLGGRIWRGCRIVCPLYVRKSRERGFGSLWACVLLYLSRGGIGGQVEGGVVVGHRSIVIAAAGGGVEVACESGWISIEGLHRRRTCSPGKA